MRKQQTSGNPVPRIFLVAALLVAGVVLFSIWQIGLPKPIPTIQNTTSMPPAPGISWAGAQTIITNLVVLLAAVIGVGTWINMRQAKARAIRHQQHFQSLDRYFAEKRAEYERAGMGRPVVPPARTAPRTLPPPPARRTLRQNQPVH
jgi:uncharacterized protein HemX